MRLQRAASTREREQERETKRKELGDEGEHEEPDDGGMVAKSCLHTVYVSPEGLSVKRRV